MEEEEEKEIVGSFRQNSHRLLNFNPSTEIRQGDSFHKFSRRNIRRTDGREFSMKHAGELHGKRFGILPALALILTLLPVAAFACANPLQLVGERGNYDEEFKAELLHISDTLDSASVLLNESRLPEAAAFLDALTEKWFALYTRYASAPPEGWTGKNEWLTCLSDVTRAINRLRQETRGGNEIEIHERVRELYTALVMLFKEDLPTDDPSVLDAVNWPERERRETPGFDPRAVEDAALFIGQKTRDLLHSLNAGTAVVELRSEGAGTHETLLVALFDRAFHYHANYRADDTVTVRLLVNPQGSLPLLQAAEASAAALRVSCRFVQVSVTDISYFPRSPGVRMRRQERIGRAVFRVMADAPDSGGAPLFVDEVVGTFTEDTLFEGDTHGVELVRDLSLHYGHYPVLDPLPPLPAENTQAIPSPGY